MNEKKIVFFDIDGTLLNSDKVISDSTKEAIDALRQNDVHVAIATGRGTSLYKDIRQELAIDCYVSFNGAHCVYDGEVIYKRALERQYLEQLTDFAHSLDCPVGYINTEEMKISRESQYAVESIASIRRPAPKVDPDFYQKNDIYQAFLFCTEELDGLFPEAVPAFDYIRWHKLSVDVVRKGGSKADAIVALADKLGYKNENVYAFGDGSNDVEMLREVGVGVAMGNATDFVKSHADYVTKHIDEDGIYYGLKHLKLI